MKIAFKFLMVAVALMACSIKANAQQMVVVMSQNYICDDPRGFDESQKWTLKKGDALLVYKEGNVYSYFGGYTAAFVEIPKRVCHLPGTVSGERYFVINATNLRLREKPSTSSGIYCYDENYGGSVAQLQFLVHPERELGVYGNSYSWKPYYLPKGTRLPYLGKVNGFYKTKFNGQVFYLSAKHCILK